MSHQASVTILGCGGSAGVPMVGNRWGNCDPAEPKNRRTRSSISIKTKSTTLVIDTGADFREQCNRENITDIDAILYTHAHSDHCGGIDDLRMLAILDKKQIPIYASKETLDTLEGRFDYLFQGGVSELYYPPVLVPNVIENGAHKIGDIPFTAFDQDHGTCVSTGYRFGDFGYSVDMFNLDDHAISALRGVHTWVVDGAAYHQSDNSVHANLDRIYELVEQVGATQTYISSLTPLMDYQTLCGELPAGIFPAYDGLRLMVNF